MKAKLTSTILGILLMIGICILTGCDTADAPISDTTLEPSATVLEPNETTLEQPPAEDTEEDTAAPVPEDTPAEETSASLEASPLPDDDVIESDTSSNNPGSAVVVHGTVESICTPKRVHNITSATYVGYEVSDAGNLILLFNTVKNHTGLEMTAQFKAIYFPEDVFSIDPADIVFEQGKTYLLLLHRYRNVYADGDEFQITDGSIIVPIDNFQSSTVDDTPLAQKVTGMKINETTTLDQFVDYLKKLTADHPGFTGQDYIQETTRSTIMAQSPHVITVTTSSITSNMSIQTVTVRCRIDEVHKGSLKEGAYIDVMFPLNAKIQMNQSFILTLNDPTPGGMDWYTFSCKDAMYPLSEANSIQAIIREQETTK